MATVEIPEEKTNAEILRLKFCKAFIKAAEKEFSEVTLKDSHKNLKASENIVKAFCSGLSLVTLNPLIGKVTAGAVKILIRKVDEVRRDRIKKTVEDKVGESVENIAEFQSAFRKLMLRSAIEIWQCYEKQFLSIQPDTSKIKRTSSLFGSFRRSSRSRSSSKKEHEQSPITLTPQEDNNNQTKNSDRNSSKKSKFQKLSSQEKLANYAAVRCIQYLVEEKKFDYPHKFVLTPQFWDTAKSKWRKFFLGDRIPLVWSDIFEDKSTIEFFKDPVPLIRHDENVALENNVNLVSNFWLINKKDQDKISKLKSKAVNKNSNDLIISITLNESQRMFQFRRHFDFEQNSQVKKSKRSKPQFVKVIFDDSTEFSQDYFLWTEKSVDVEKVYEELMLDQNFTKFDESQKLSVVLEKLTKVSEAMKEFKKDFENLKLNVDKIIAEQSVVKTVVLNIQCEQTKMSENVDQVIKLENEIKDKVEDLRDEQIEIKVKVEEIHAEILKNKDRRRLSRGLSIIQNSNPNPVPVSNFTTIEKAPVWFTGREDSLDDIRSIISSIDNIDRSNVLNRMVVISGLGGIGKSSIAKMYAQKYRQNHKNNIAWLNAETEEGLKSSFFLLADHFKICQHILNRQAHASTSGGLHSQTDIMTVVQQVYRHFSLHVKEGLLIFDNANQMRSTHGEFGIQDFLPVDILENYPIFLITSRNKNWTMISRKIHLETLSTNETMTFFWKSLHLPEIRQVEKVDEFFALEKVVESLSQLLDGHPLACNLAAASILENLELLGYFHESDDQPQDYFCTVCTEVENYITQYHQNGLKWVTYEGEGGVVSRYDKIMATVWEGTMNKLKKEFKCDDDPLYKIASDLLNLIAYLPTDLISVEFCHFIYNCVQIKEETFMQQIIQGQRSQVRKAFGVLEKYSMVSIVTQEGQLHYPYYQKYSGSSVRVHRLVQKWTRESLKKNCQFEHVLKLAKYLQGNGLRFEYWDCVRDHLKDLKWPLQSYRNGIFIHHFGIYPQGNGPWREIYGFFEQNPNLKEIDPEYWRISKLALNYYEFQEGKDLEDQEINKDNIETETEQILNRTIELVLEYQKNQILYQLATDILFHVPFETLVTQDREEKLQRWIRSHFKFLSEESSNPVFSSILSPTVPVSSFHKDLKVQSPLTFLSLSGKLMDAEELVALITVATEFRLRHDGHLHCLSFLSSALLRIRSWPIDIWRLSTTPPLSPGTNDVTARRLLTTFLENRGMALLTRALIEFQEIFRRGHFIEMRRMVVFGLIQNFAYFDEIAVTLLKSSDFVLALTQVFQAATQQSDKTVNDRRAHIGIVFSWFALLVKKDRLASAAPCLNISIVEDNMKNFVGKLDEYQQKSIAIDMDENGEHSCPVYYNEIRLGRFSRSRKAIVQLFIKSRQAEADNEDDVEKSNCANTNDDVLLYCGVKLLEILETKCTCMTP